MQDIVLGSSFGVSPGYSLQMNLIYFLRLAGDGLFFVCLKGGALLQNVKIDQGSALLASNRNENKTET